MTGSLRGRIPWDTSQVLSVRLWSSVGRQRGVPKVTLETGEPLAAALDPRALRAAHCSQRDPDSRWGPEWPLPGPAGSGEAGAPLLGPFALGLGGEPGGSERGGGGGAGPPFVRGFARRGRASLRCRSPLGLGGRGSRPGPRGAVGVGFGSRAAGAGGPSLVRSPWKPLPRWLGLQSRRPPPPSRGSFLPAAPPSSRRLCAERAARGLGGCPGGAGGGGGAGSGRRAAASPALPASGEGESRAARGRRAPPARPERSLLFPARSSHAGTVTAAGWGGRRAAGSAAQRRIEVAACHAAHGAAAAGRGLAGAAAPTAEERGCRRDKLTS